MGLNNFSKDYDGTASNMSARERREKFKNQLRECDQINAVTNGPNQNVYRARTKHDDALVWTHYSKAFNFWGGSAKKNDELQARGPALIHAFLGADPDEYYVVPDNALHSGDFYMPVSDKNGSEQWRLAGKGDGGRNRELLEASYTSLCAPFE